MSKKITTELFIERAKQVHGDLYDYTKTIYVSVFTVVIVTCPDHGDFMITPGNHTQGCGCKQCRYLKSSTANASNTAQFIYKAIQIHGQMYNYNNVKYINNCTPVFITCNVHGDFMQRPASHINGAGCIKCSYDKRALQQSHTTDMFISNARVVHGCKYNYDKVCYINNATRIIITCNIHGDFQQLPASHINGAGCPCCSIKSYSVISIQWLNTIMIAEDIVIQHAENVGEWVIPNTRITVDGYCKETNTIYEFYGNYWHGNPQLHTPCTYNITLRTTMGELFQKTIDREQKIKNLGYNLITIWESDYKQLLKTKREL